MTKNGFKRKYIEKYYYYYYYYMDLSCHRPFLPGTSLEPRGDPHRSGFKLHTSVLSVLRVMFQVQPSFVVILLLLLLLLLLGKAPNKY